MGVGAVSKRRIISVYLNTRHTLANVQYVPLKSAGLYLVQELQLSCVHTHIYQYFYMHQSKAIFGKTSSEKKKKQTLKTSK